MDTNDGWEGGLKAQINGEDPGQARRRKGSPSRQDKTFLESPCGTENYTLCCWMIRIRFLFYNAIANGGKKMWADCGVGCNV